MMLISRTVYSVLFLSIMLVFIGNILLFPVSNSSEDVVDILEENDDRSGMENSILDKFSNKTYHKNGMAAMYTVLLNNSSCTQMMKLQGWDYWSRKKLGKIIDIAISDQRIFGRFVSTPKFCFWVSKIEADDSIMRLFGYKEAIKEILLSIYFEHETTENWTEWTKSKTIRRYREIISRLIGKKFDSPQNLFDWWKENEAYLKWSKKSDRLVVDFEAKKKEMPVIRKAVVNLPAADYWYYKKRNYIKINNEDENFLYGIVYDPYHEGSYFRVSKASIANREAKQTGYKRALEWYISLVDIEFKKFEIPKSVRQILQDLTGKNFATREQWIEWWKQKKNNLVLSPDGERLIEKPTKESVQMDS